VFQFFTVESYAVSYQLSPILVTMFYCTVCCLV